MQPVKVLEVLADGKVRVELPESDSAKQFGLRMVLMVEFCCHTVEDMAQFRRNLQEKMPIMYERYMEYCATPASLDDAAAALRPPNS